MGHTGMRTRMTRKMTTVVALAAAMVLACVVKAESQSTEKPRAGIDAMTEKDRVFYVTSFTTLVTVPYGRCWPTNLFNMVLAGRKVQDGARFVSFNTPKQGCKQNEGYSEWLRVKTITLERDTLRVLSASGSVGPFGSEDAVQSYLNTEVRPDLNGQVYIVKDETCPTNGVMSFVCESKWGDNYNLRISFHEDSPDAIWMDVLGSLAE